MEILIIAILTLLNGFFALSELSIISVNKGRMEQKARNGNRNAQTVMELLREPEDFLSAIQVGITLIGIVSGAYGGAALSDDAREWMQRVPFLAPYADTLSLVLVIGLITYFTIVIGELIPKTLALGNASGIALAVSPVVKVFTLLTMPLVKLPGGSTSLVIGLFGIKNQQRNDFRKKKYGRSSRRREGRACWLGKRASCTRTCSHTPMSGPVT